MYTRQGAKQAHSQAVRERENPVKSSLQRPLPSHHVILVYKIEVEVRAGERFRAQQRSRVTVHGLLDPGRESGGVPQ